MSDDLDREIRELFEELDAAAPSPPPTPRIPEAAPVPLWQKALLPVGVVGALLLVVGVATQLMSGGAADEATGTTEDMTATTAAGATDTTASQDQPVDTRPPDFALVLADLNLSCNMFTEATGQAVLAAPSTDAEYLAALGALTTPLAELDESIQAVNADLEDVAFTPIATASTNLVNSVSDAANGPASEAASGYAGAATEIGELGDALSAYGAIDCTDLGQAIP